MLRVTRGAKTLNVYARDIEAIRANPPRVTFATRGTGNEKMAAFLRTGVPQEFTAVECGEFGFDLPFLESVQKSLQTNADAYKLQVGPSELLLQKRLRTRITFRLQSDVVEYSFIEFAPTRGGTDEVELKSVSQDLPFILTFVIPLKPKPGGFSFKHDFVGKEIPSIQKITRALGILRAGGEVFVHDLERDKGLFNAKLTVPQESPQQGQFRELVEDLIAIENGFNVKLRFPPEMSEQDRESIELLKLYLEGGTEEVTEMEGILVKSLENESTFTPQLISGGGGFRFQTANVEPKPVVFGIPISTGPCAMTAEQAQFEDTEGTIESFRNAAVGDSVAFKIKPLVPVRFELLEPEDPGK